MMLTFDCIYRIIWCTFCRFIKKFWSKFASIANRHTLGSAKIDFLIRNIQYWPLPPFSYFNLYADLVTGVIFFEFTTLYFLLGSTGFLVAQNVILLSECVTDFAYQFIYPNYSLAFGWKQWNHSIQNRHVGCALKVIYYVRPGKWNFASSKIDKYFSQYFLIRFQRLINL